MENDMKELKFIGIGGAHALELGGNCAFLKDDDTLLVIDCCEEATSKLIKKGVFDDIKNIIIAITHTHFDHVAGLGTLLFYSNYMLKIKPKIVRNSQTFESHLKQLLLFLGLREKYYDFISPSEVKVNNCILNAIPTTHSPILECFGIMFKDEHGEYYYSGDTNDFDNIKGLVSDSNVKKIYCEVCWKPHNAHIEYEKLKEIKCDKLVLMHFEDINLYNLAKQDGFNVAKI